MHYSNLIRSTGNKELLDKIDELKKFTQEQSVPAPFDNDQLSREEVDKVTDFLCYLEREYFNDIPLDTDIVKNFIYNIPKKIYNLFETMVLKETDDVFNPILFLYPFFISEPDDIVLFVDKINNLITEDHVEYIEEYKDSIREDDEE